MTNPIDQYVGDSIRTLRGQKGITQTDLAKTVGVSFQQIQKYEKGSNRVSASRLAEIATVLEVPVQSFFPKELHDGGLSKEELGVLSSFRQADDQGRASIVTVASAVSRPSSALLQSQRRPEWRM